MTDSKRPDPYPDHNPRKGGSDVSETSGRLAGPGVRPKYLREDFTNLLSKMRYDLTALQAKVTELSNMLATVEIATGDAPFNEERFLRFVRHTAHVYTDESLLDELNLQNRGGTLDSAFIDVVLETAASVRALTETGADEPPAACHVAAPVSVSDTAKEEA